MRRKTTVLLAVLVLAAGVTLAGAPNAIVIGTCEFDASELPNKIKEGTGCITDSAVGWEWPESGNYGNDRGHVAVIWESDTPDVPNNTGRWAEVTIEGKKGIVPIWIHIEYLAGLANDDFCVLVKAFKSSSPTGPDHYVSIDCAEEHNDGGEIFLMKDMEMPGLVFHPGQDITIQFRATGNAWASRDTYGQVAIRKIIVRGRKGQHKTEIPD